MVKLLFLRHGLSVTNKLGCFCGQLDAPLDEEGYVQAEQVAEYICANYKIDAIYSSDLKRAYNTAMPHATRRGLSVQPSKELREIRLGDWEGKKVAEVIVEYGDMYDKDWLLGYGTFRFPGGESTIEAGERFLAECSRIAEENDGKTVLVTAHAAVIRSFFSLVMNIPPEEVAGKLPFPTNASFSEVFYEGGKFTSGRFSVDDHLCNVGITKL